MKKEKAALKLLEQILNCVGGCICVWGRDRGGMTGQQSLASRKPRVFCSPVSYCQEMQAAIKMGHQLTH